MGVLPPLNGGIGYDPWPYRCGSTLKRQGKPQDFVYGSIYRLVPFLSPCFRATARKALLSPP